MISSRTHGIVDYVAAAALAAVPRLLGWDRRMTRAMDFAALGTVAYAHLTDYELGAHPLLSMKQHLAVDALEGATFLAAAWMLEDEPAPVRWTLAGYGLFALSAAALTDRQAGGHPGDRRSGGRRVASGAWIMDGGDDNDRNDEEDWEDAMDYREQTRAGGRTGSGMMHDGRLGDRVGASDWGSQAGPEFRRHIAEVGRDQEGRDRDGRDNLGGHDWRQARDQRGSARLSRTLGSKADRPAEELRRVQYTDARQGYLHGQGI